MSKSDGLSFVLGDGRSGHVKKYAIFLTEDAQSISEELVPVADDYVGLSKEDRLEALVVAAGASGRRVHLLEKDIWAVLTLDALHRSTEGPNIVFKGGTSLSKAYGVIKRFSEDMDVTTTSEGFCPSLPKATPPFLKTTPKRRSGGSSSTSACQAVLYARRPRKKSRMF